MKRFGLFKALFSLTHDKLCLCGRLAENYPVLEAALQVGRVEYLYDRIVWELAQ